jgi:8-oxo-dGTP diphosphatase
MTREFDQPRLATCTLILDSQNRVLLGKRLTKVFTNHYGMPGGRLKIGESPLPGASRESAEETSLILKNPFPLAVILDHQNPPVYEFIHFGILCTQFSGIPTLTEPGKCAGWDWYPLDQLPSPIVPAHLALINCYLSCQPSPRLTFLEISTNSPSSPALS